MAASFFARVTVSRLASHAMSPSPPTCAIAQNASIDRRGWRLTGLALWFNGPLRSGGRLQCPYASILMRSVPR